MDICLELKPKQGELRPQKNNPGQHITRENVAEYDPDESTLLNIRMETAQYGLYEAQPAILIVLRFIVKFRGGNRRIRSFNVNVEFSNHSDVEQIPSPSVKAFAPDDCDGTLFGLEDNPDTSLVEQRRFLPTIEGWKKSSKDGPDNIVVWDCVETERRIAGLPAGYRGVIVIQHAKDAKLQATFKVHVDCGRFNVARRIYDWSKLFSAARRDDPVIFLPGQAFGRQYPALQDFKHLDLSTLSRLGQRSVRPSSTTKNR